MPMSHAEAGRLGGLARKGTGLAKTVRIKHSLERRVRSGKMTQANYQSRVQRILKSQAKRIKGKILERRAKSLMITEKPLSSVSNKDIKKANKYNKLAFSGLLKGTKLKQKFPKYFIKGGK